MATPRSIAEWMLEELKQQTILSQEVVAHEIALLFGDEFTYTNANGDIAIDESVLREFRHLTGDLAVAVGGGRVWRLRQS
jgi:hypothetical protein